MKDHYKRLGLNYKATPAEIKSAYRRLALKYHPDKNNGDPQYEAIFKEINEAHAVLSDPALKQRYDYIFFRRQEPQPTYRTTNQTTYRTTNQGTYRRAYAPPPNYKWQKKERKKEPSARRYIWLGGMIILLTSNLFRLLSNQESRYKFDSAPVIYKTAHGDSVILNNGDSSATVYPFKNNKDTGKTGDKK